MKPDKKQSAPPPLVADDKLPHSYEGERGVIGSILTDGGGKPLDMAVQAGMTADWFYSADTRAIYEAIAHLRSTGLPIDTLAITARLKDTGTLQAAGGEDALYTLIDQTPTSGHMEYYIALVCNAHAKRMLIGVSSEAIADALDSQQSADFARAKAETAMAAIGRNALKRRVTVKEIVRNAVQSWVDNANGTAPVGIQTGIKWLDDATAGVLNGSYWVISGRPGSCKSTLCRMIAESVAQSGVHVAVKTTEQTDEQYVGAMAAALASLSVHELNKPGFPKYLLNRLLAAEKTVAAWPLDVDGEMVTRSQLSSWYTSSVARGSRLQVLDYLQDVIPETREEMRSPEQRVSAATQELRRLSKQTGVPIITVSTESNDGALRYSGQVEYDAALWVRMSKAEDYDPLNNPKYVATINKSRFAPPGTVVELFYLYGMLLNEADYYSRLAVLAGSAGSVSSMTTGSSSNPSSTTP